MTASTTYSYFCISKTSDLKRSAQLFRTLRLRGLQVSPSSFSSTYDIEAAFTSADWEDRLLAADRQTFICVATTTCGGKEASEWVGQVTLRGPMSKADWALPPEAGQLAIDSESDEKWHLLGLFLLPEHQGGGRGKQLCRAAVEYLESCLDPALQLHVRLMVRPGNQAIVRFYEALGYVQTGNCTLAEALLANGDGHLLPADSSSAKYSARGGIIMNLKRKR